MILTGRSRGRWGGGSVPVGEGGGDGDPGRWRGSRRLPKLPEGNLSLSADFRLARGIDDVTVQKSADVSEVESPYTILLRHKPHNLT